MPIHNGLIPAKLAIVTACDSRYFNLAAGWFQSVLRQLWVACNDYLERPDKTIGNPGIRIDEHIYFPEIVIIDVGLKPFERTYFEGEHSFSSSFPIKLVTVDKLSYDLNGDDNIKRTQISYLERCRLPTHIPGYDIYMWMDCDTWMQDFSTGLLPFLIHAHHGNFPIVPEVDPSFVFNFNAQDVSMGWKLGNYTKYLGPEVCAAFSSRPMFNNGIFAAHRTSPVWDLWHNAMIYAMIRNNNRPEFGIDQITLAWMIYQQAVAIRPKLLSFLSNWLVVHAPPLRHFKLDKLVSPILPYNIIGNIHLIDNSKWERVHLQTLNTENHQIVGSDPTYFDYFGINGEHIGGTPDVRQ